MCVGGGGGVRGLQGGLELSLSETAKLHTETILIYACMSSTLMVWVRVVYVVYACTSSTFMVCV